ncbi:MAG: DUF3078 domain-containing protein [Alphaproteobacteria bacterium]|nr:DUF3078 domain-containing protein [Alphaproteobacteria bacterium]
MVKNVCGVMLAVLLSGAAYAADDVVTENATTLNLAVRRIGLEWSKTDVRNSEYYQESPVSALKADSQDFIKGVFDTALEYNKNRFQWDNSLFMEYGETKLKPYDEPVTVSENADDILFSSNLSYACWEFSGFKFGPTVRGAYDTEFKTADSTPRQNILRANAGLSLFDNQIIKSLYLTGVYEYDFTYAGDQTSKMAAEIGWRLEYQVREGVKLSTNGYYREYLSYSEFIPTDLERDLSAVVRMDTNLWGDLTMGPYVQYRRARARGVDVYGSNFIMGISFNYITSFGLM